MKRFIAQSAIIVAVMAATLGGLESWKRIAVANATVQALKEELAKSRAREDEYHSRPPEQP
jgi:nitroreductase